ncbi:MAG: uncharacterized protein A8A55_3492, partial [Amphiamblys sp. WSBS2006]
MLENIKRIADEQNLWCRGEGERRLALSWETKNALEELRALKGRSIHSGPLSEEDKQKLANAKTVAKRMCRGESRARFARWQSEIAKDVANGDTRAAWRLAKQR